MKTKIMTKTGLELIWTKTSDLIQPLQGRREGEVGDSTLFYK